jgi:hypothetical protein
MRRLGILLAALLASTAAQAQTPRSLQEVLFGTKANPPFFTLSTNLRPDPQSELLARLAKDFPPRPVVMRDSHPVVPPRIVVLFDPGGVLSTYENRWRMAAAEGAEVAITNGCQSACTLVTAFVPKDRICFSEFSYLSFHQARHANNAPSPESTRWMINQYPPDIRGWLEARGGIENLPLNSYWTLSAKHLWAMGYRKCND